MDQTVERIAECELPTEFGAFHLVAYQDGIDNDSDGYTDCDDYSCSRSDTVTVCGSTGNESNNAQCSNGQDDDGDGGHRRDDADDGEVTAQADLRVLSAESSPMSRVPVVNHREHERVPLELVDVADLMQGVEFKVFAGPASDPEGRVAALRLPAGSEL